MKKLSKEELEIENMADSMVSAGPETKERVEAILSEARKNRAISLRISSADLDLLKSKAAIEGIPYQTLINSVLHKYVTNQLLDKNEALKSLSLLQK